MRVLSRFICLFVRHRSSAEGSGAARRFFYSRGETVSQPAAPVPCCEKLPESSDPGPAHQREPSYTHSSRVVPDTKKIFSEPGFLSFPTPFQEVIKNDYIRHSQQGQAGGQPVFSYHNTPVLDLTRSQSAPQTPSEPSVSSRFTPEGSSSDRDRMRDRYGYLRPVSDSSISNYNSNTVKCTLYGVTYGSSSRSNPPR